MRTVREVMLRPGEAYECVMEHGAVMRHVVTQGTVCVTIVTDEHGLGQISFDDGHEATMLDERPLQ